MTVTGVDTSGAKETIIPPTFCEETLAARVLEPAGVTAAFESSQITLPAIRDVPVVAVHVPPALFAKDASVQQLSAIVVVLIDNDETEVPVPVLEASG